MARQLCWRVTDYTCSRFGIWSQPGEPAKSGTSGMQMKRAKQTTVACPAAFATSMVFNAGSLADACRWGIVVRVQVILLEKGTGHG